MAVRKKYDIPKPKITEQRIFEKIPETAYGAQAQVDFGESWQEEKKHLLPIKNKIYQKENKRSYNVRKDNTIVYKSNYYSLPAGTYKKPGTRVFLESDEGKINIYSQENELIASHKISIGKGGYIRNTDHKRQKSGTLEQMEIKVMEMLGQTEIAGDYLKKIRQDKQRYYKDNLREIIKQPLQYEQQTIDESIMVCIEARQYNAFVLLEVMKSKHLEKQQKQQAQEALKNISQSQIKSTSDDLEMEVLKSDINEYEKIF